MYMRVSKPLWNALTVRASVRTAWAAVRARPLDFVLDFWALPCPLFYCSRLVIIHVLSNKKNQWSEYDWRHKANASSVVPKLSINCDHIGNIEIFSCAIGTMITSMFYGPIYHHCRLSSSTESYIFFICMVIPSFHSTQVEAEPGMYDFFFVLFSCIAPTLYSRGRCVWLTASLIHSYPPIFYIVYRRCPTPLPFEIRTNQDIALALWYLFFSWSGVCFMDHRFGLLG